jgi:hypothetical protein
MEWSSPFLYSGIVELLPITHHGMVKPFANYIVYHGMVKPLFYYGIVELLPIMYHGMVKPFAN